MIDALLTHPGDAVALEFGRQTLSYHQLFQGVEQRAQWLTANSVTRVALLMDNCPEWVLFDLACQQAGICCIPVPGFFSPAQRQHLMQQADVELQLSSASAADPSAQPVDCPFEGVYALRFEPAQTARIPDNTGKITFTSGSTGTPKGVCLSTESQWVVARSLVDRIGIQGARHLCVLPLPTLLENIAGVYAPLLAGGTVVLASEGQRGFSGSRLLQPQALFGLISQVQPNTLILVPELLSLLVMAARQGWQPPASLRFIAVGGAHVSSRVLQAARALELPVYQGYGLSECVSVTALNVPGNEQLDSVGAPLAHNSLTIENDEVVVRGNVFLGYLNEPDSFYPQQVNTGDLGALKGNYLHIDGRRKHLLINSFGRNISPEWIESELLASGVFRQLMVVGDAQPFCTALVVPLSDSVSDEQIHQAILQANQGLPDYAQVSRWLRVPAFTAEDDLLTDNGKLKRPNILARYQSTIQTFYHHQA